MEILLGQLPEAIFFALFMIFTKEYKEKRILFTVSTSVEYILLMNIFPYSIWSHVLYFILTYIIMKILYKEKCNVTDVFILCIASLIMTITSGILYFIIWKTINNYYAYVILQRIVLFILLLAFKNKLPNIKLLYRKLWNRDEFKHKMKTTTFRAMNLVLFNISFVVINLGMIFALFAKEVFV